MYEHILKPIFFRFDPEKVHNFMVNFGEKVGNNSLLRGIISSVYNYRHSNTIKVIDGIKYRTPIMLSAGFDYNARLMNILPDIGLGGEEIGSVTARPCIGNPSPQLTRLPKSKSILVNKGLKNDGVDKIIERIKKYKKKISGKIKDINIDKTNPDLNYNSNIDFVIGISIARTNDNKSISIESGIEDYLYSFKRLNEENIGNYYTINISCPNAFGGESFADPILLNRLLKALKSVECKKPIYIKMPINLDWQKFKELLNIIDINGINGVIIGNLNKNYNDLIKRDEAPANYCGGLSGDPCRNLSTELIKKTKDLYAKRFTIIGCGGIMSVKDAQDKFDAGADLIQLITGLIYQGPSLVKKICKDVKI